jgi:hypothetical protein
MLLTQTHLIDTGKNVREGERGEQERKGVQKKESEGIC